MYPIFAYIRSSTTTLKDMASTSGIQPPDNNWLSREYSDAQVQPLDEYYLWCDHRAKDEAAEITEAARQQKLPAIDWCGGVYSSEWGFSKLLHWLRNNPENRGRFASAFENCDMVAATLCGITDPGKVKRSACAMGHKWMWNASLGGLPPEEFLASVDPLLAGVREKLQGN